jgi:hypothetical protein
MTYGDGWFVSAKFTWLNSSRSSRRLDLPTCVANVNDCHAFKPGHVDVDALSERTRNNYLLARATLVAASTRRPKLCHVPLDGSLIWAPGRYPAPREATRALNTVSVTDLPRPATSCATGSHSC